MKKWICLFIVIASLTACKGKGGGWSSGDRSKFVSTCANAAAGTMGEAKAKSYCECMLPKIEAKYPNADDANKPEAQTELSKDIMAMAQDCLK